MSTDETQAFLDSQAQNRGYSLEMHRIMAEVDLEWAKTYGAFIEATYTGQRTLDRKTKELLQISGGSGPEGRRGANPGPCAGGPGKWGDAHGKYWRPCSR